MQGERSIFESFPENIDLNQGSVSNNANMDQTAALNMINPAESRLSNYVLSSVQGNSSCVNPASRSGRTFSGWDPGESSSRANMQSQSNAHDLKMGQSWSPSVNTCVAADGSSADWQFEQPNFLLHESSTTGYRGHYFHGPPSICNSVSTRTSQNAAMSGSYQSSDDSWQGRGSGVYPNFYRSGRSEIGQFPTFDAASDDVGTSSGSSGYLVQHDDGCGSSSSTWGLSGKRKALEGNSGQSCPNGTLSMDPQIETIGRHTIPAHYNASSSLTVSASSTNLHSANNLGQLNPRMVSGMRGMTCDGFPSSRVTEVAENSQRNFSFGVNLGHQESVPFDLSAAGTDVRHSTVHSTNHQSRLIPTTELPELRSPFPHPLNLNNTPSQSSLMQAHGLANSMLPFPCNGSLNSRGGASSSPILFSGERGAAVRDEATFRSSLSNNPEHSSFVAASESRHMAQEPTGWSFSPGNTGSSRNVSSSSRITPISGTRSLPTVWMPHLNPAAHNQQRLSEFPPSTLFPSIEPDIGGQRGHFSFLPSASSSSEVAVMSSGYSSGDQNQPYSRSLLMDVSSNDISGWRALAAGIEGRHRVASEIRQVLNAMRRAENLQVEEYMLLDPFINGAAELHDRHGDLRLDVDNMSYEELLALEERIGNVSTGLGEDAMSRALRRRKYRFVINGSPNLEPCCICREYYIVGDDIGTLDCGHEFHTNCIKQWLTLKNQCPICKSTALET